MTIDWEKTKINIKEKMKHSGYSLKKMADGLYISESILKNYLYGDTKIPIETLCNMVNMFDMEKIEDLLDVNKKELLTKNRKEKQLC